MAHVLHSVCGYNTLGKKTHTKDPAMRGTKSIIKSVLVPLVAGFWMTACGQGGIPGGGLGLIAPGTAPGHVWTSYSGSVLNAGAYRELLREQRVCSRLTCKTVDSYPSMQVQGDLGALTQNSGDGTNISLVIMPQSSRSAWINTVPNNSIRFWGTLVEQDDGSYSARSGVLKLFVYPTTAEARQISFRLFYRETAILSGNLEN